MAESSMATASPRDGGETEKSGLTVEKRAKWERGTASVLRGQIVDGEERYPWHDEQVAYTHAGIPGLAVTTDYFDGWKITHVGSGRSVGDSAFPNRRAAQSACRKIAALADWTRSPDELRSVEGLGDSVRAALSSPSGAAPTSTAEGTNG